MPGYEDPIWKEYLKQFKAAEDMLMRALDPEPQPTLRLWDGWIEPEESEKNK